MIEAIALWIGHVILICGGLTMLAALVVAAAYLGNMAQHKALEMFGGWKVFMEFVDWHRNARSVGTSGKEGAGDA